MNPTTDQTDPPIQSDRRPRRLWPRRLATDLPWPIRRVQQWRHDDTFPARDQTDDQAAADWPAYLVRVRTWIQERHPSIALAIARKHGGFYRPDGRPSDAPSPSAVTTADGFDASMFDSDPLAGMPRPGPHATIDEHAKWHDARAKAYRARQSEIDLRRTQAQLIERGAASAFAVLARARANAALDQLGSRIIDLLPAESQIHIRALLGQLLSRIKDELAGDLRREWTTAIPKPESVS